MATLRFTLLTTSLSLLTLAACSSASFDVAPIGVEDATPPDTGVVADGSDTALDTSSTDAPPSESLDPERDGDGDGYPAKIDCDDSDPLVNPGAFEVIGDKIDNDCDGKADNPEPDCDDGGLPFDSTNPLDFAKALGLCRTTTLEAKGREKRWGVIGAALVRADGSGPVDRTQHGVLHQFGAVVPRSGKSLVVLSSGTARTPDLAGYASPRASTGGTSAVTPPDGWPRNSEGCPSPLSKTANDSINLKLTIRVPTNARSFKYDFDFYTSEYLSFVCSAYNDQFVAILDTKAALDAKYGKNVAFDPKGNPINVNSAGFLDVCTPGSKTTPKPLTFPCKKGIGELSGTGFIDPFDKTAGAATSWLETLAPVVPGEIITVQFMVWNTGDHFYSSTIVLDNWQWHLIPQGTPVTERPTD